MSKHGGSQQGTKSKTVEPAATGSKVNNKPGAAQQRRDQGQRSKGQRRGRMTTDEDTTPTLSPTRTDARDDGINTTRDTYSTDEDTPRFVIYKHKFESCCTKIVLLPYSDSVAPDHLDSLITVHVRSLTSCAIFLQTLLLLVVVSWSVHFRI